MSKFVIVPDNKLEVIYIAFDNSDMKWNILSMLNQM